MKRILCLLIPLTLLFVLAACAKPAPEPAPVETSPSVAPEAPTPTPTEQPAPPPPAPVAQDVFYWDDFTDRDPNNKPETSTNGASMWWDNWANLRASAEGGVVTINFRPGEFDPEDYDNEADYFARAADWMGNWGEAVDMWSLEGISYCKYFTIRMSGAEGGEENKLMLHFQPEDGPSFVKRFSDLVTKDGGNPVITTSMQDIVIDLQASGFPGMTNRMHIRAFAGCTISLDEIYFSGAIAPIDATSVDTILGGFTVKQIGNPADLPISTYIAAASGAFSWDDFTGRDPNNKPETSTNGASMWWDNWANLRASADNGVIQINFRPGAFDPEDYDNEADYFARAADWMGNWGEAVDMWSLEGISYCKYLTIRMSGAEGGEENKLMLHFQPEDGPSFVKRFSDLVTKEGGSPAITTDMQDIVIDLQASGFPGMTNRMHIRAFVGCTISLDEIYFSGAIAPIDTTSVETIISGFTVEAIGNPADLPISSYIKEAS
jgi:hypothetical protein